MLEKEAVLLPLKIKRETTATVFILENEQVLLIYHKKFKKWLPPGGHIYPNELPHEAAIREAKEETGLEIILTSDEHLWIEPKWNARSIERPFMCLLENIPSINGEPPHQHFDLIFVGRPIGGELLHNATETEGIKWFTLKELEGLEKETDIFEETFEAILKLLSQLPVK